MKKIFKIFAAISLSASALCTIAQHVERESVEFTYTKLPSKPLGKGLKGYATIVKQESTIQKK